MARGLTQQTLADRLGCWYQSVAAWERGLSEPVPARWPAIEAVLGSGLVPRGEGLSCRIRAARLRAGLTQVELALKAGVDARTVRNAERACHSPSKTTLAKLEGVIGALA